MWFDTTGAPELFAARPGWRDYFTVLGAVGSLVTLLGFVIALAQLRQATRDLQHAASVTEAASHAAQAAEEAMKSQFRRYLLMQVSEKEKIVSLHLQHSAWKNAAPVVGDLADLLARLHEFSDTWEMLAVRSRDVQQSLEQVRSDVTNPKAAKDWRSLSKELRAQLARSLPAFETPVQVEERNDPNG